MWQEKEGGLMKGMNCKRGEMRGMRVRIENSEWKI